jgi:hypothetical protein
LLPPLVPSPSSRERGCPSATREDGVREDKRHRASSRALLASRVSICHHALVKIRDFLNAVYNALLEQLPKRYRKHESRIRFGYLQVYFDSPAIHYEAWVQRRARRIELGLHFEGEREANYRWAEVLGARALEVQAQLGGAVELEEWTESWTRLHETRQFERDLTLELADELAARLCRFIEVMEPILAEERDRV